MQRTAVVRNLISSLNERPAPQCLPRFKRPHNFAVAPNHQRSRNVRGSICAGVIRVRKQDQPAYGAVVVRDLHLVNAYLVRLMPYNSLFRVLQNYMSVAIAVRVHADNYRARVRPGRGTYEKCGY